MALEPPTFRALIEAALAVAQDAGPEPAEALAIVSEILSRALADEPHEGEPQLGCRTCGGSGLIVFDIPNGFGDGPCPGCNPPAVRAERQRAFLDTVKRGLDINAARSR